MERRKAKRHGMLGPRTRGRLPARVDKLSKPGRHADGGNLYFVISKGGHRKWTFLYKCRESGAPIELGLGSYPDVSLAMARDRAEDLRRLLASGKDPKVFKDQAEKDAASRAEKPTFEQVLDTLIASRASGWRNAKHRQQWRNSVVQHAGNLLKLRIDEVATDDVLQAIEPIWASKAETASRVRNRIENTLDYAKSKGFRDGENPARWRGHLQHILPKRRKLTRGHHQSMPYEKVPAFVARLRESQSVSARALEVLVRCALRTGEVVNAEWREIDLSTATWTIPAERMKSGVEFKIPLPPRAVAILKELAAAKQGDYVFVGKKREKPLSNMALEALLRKWNVKPFTVHGFRSSFRTWAAEKTDVPREVAEACLAHVVAENAVERAYLRTDLLDARRRLLRRWERFLDPTRIKRK